MASSTRQVDDHGAASRLSFQLPCRIPRASLAARSCRPIASRCLGFRSEPSRCHTCWRKGIGVSPIHPDQPHPAQDERHHRRLQLESAGKPYSRTGPRLHGARRAMRAASPPTESKAAAHRCLFPGACVCPSRASAAREHFPGAELAGRNASSLSLPVTATTWVARAARACR